MKLLTGLFVAAILTASATPASAAIVYNLAFRLPGEVASFDSRITADAGETFSGVEILLIETVDSPSESILGNDSLVDAFVPNRFGNLTAFKASVEASGSDGDFSSLSSNLDGGNPGPGLNDRTISFLAIGAGLGSAGKTSVALGVLPNGKTAREAVLGTVTLIAPTAGETTFSVNDFSSVSSDFGTFGIGSLEIASRDSGGSFNNGSLTLVTAIPEPSSLAFLMAVGTICVARRRQRRIVS
ncbi:PEP-CTERM sorting domain-containing protein [Rhodopirellula sp. JC639]|uniref:PEP-CTERM sorting domain-containing protein n=1 Tax=Stieleria mannarensis TaxID=2755585 RepID=UPI00160218BF|nr:PEP-CTERM sorting domain-containing protein [Rhodopirellula sp. JC639]